MPEARQAVPPTSGAATPPSTVVPAPLLSLRDVRCGYGASQVLFDLSLDVAEGECVSLQGRNGMGKSTTVRAIMGQLALWHGEILWKGCSIRALPTHRIARLGVGLTPEGRQVFPNLTVRENLVATARPSPPLQPAASPAPLSASASTPASASGPASGPASASASASPSVPAPAALQASPREGWTLERVFALFPALARRHRNFGNQLSGGEQQMLAVGRALMTNPQLLILDEATEGLSPLLRQEIWRVLESLRSQGMSILVIDKHLGPLLRLCDRHVLIEKGRCVWQGDSQALASAPQLHQRYLGT